MQIFRIICAKSKKSNTVYTIGNRDKIFDIDKIALKNKIRSGEFEIQGYKLSSDNKLIKVPSQVKKDLEIIERINYIENRQVLVYGGEHYKYILYKDWETALEYPQYSKYVTSMQGLFEFVEIDKLDLSKFDTSNVKDMHNMFASSKIKSIKFGGKFSTENVRNMGNMFIAFSGGSLDLRQFNLKNVSHFNNMFYFCNAQEINISGLKIRKDANTKEMFTKCQSKIIK